MKQISTTSSFQTNVTAISDNDNISKVVSDPVFMDNNYFLQEKYAYEKSDKVDLDFESLGSDNSRTVGLRNRNIPDVDAYVINTGIRAYDQFSSSFCTAHACCFLYTYIMAVGVNRSLNEVSWWEYANSPNAPPLAKYIITVLEEARAAIRPGLGINYNDSFSSNYNDTHDLNSAVRDITFGRTLKYMDESIFVHTFTMWSAFYIPRGADPINNDLQIFTPMTPNVNNGTEIPNVLVAMINFGCISASKNFSRSPYIFDSLFENNRTKRDSNEFFTKITNNAFDSKIIFPNFPEPPPWIGNVEETNTYCKSVIDNISNYARSTWEYQQNNNFKIITIKGNEESFIKTLRAGYPITISMTLINYKLGGEQIPFIRENGIDYVMRYTNISEQRSDIKIQHHTVVAVGFIKFKGGKTYLRIRNSWGSNWGDKGHFWMPMSYIEYCTGFYTIALKTDIFPEIRKLEFNVLEIKIELDEENLTIINLLGYMTNVNISTIDYINVDDLQYKIESIPNKAFNVDINKDSNILYIQSSPGGCKLTVFYTTGTNDNFSNIFSTSVNLFWNLKVPEVFFTLATSNPPVAMTSLTVNISPKSKILPFIYKLNLLPPSLSNSDEPSYFYLYRSIIRSSSKITYSVNNLKRASVSADNIFYIFDNKPGSCILTTDYEDKSGLKIRLRTSFVWDLNFPSISTMSLTIKQLT
jgi:hypothetical protein